MTDTLRAALEFYANSENYRAAPGAKVTSTGAHRASPVERECGELAREALASLSAHPGGGGESVVQQAADVIRAERIRQQGGERVGFVAFNWGNDFAHALDSAGLLASSPGQEGVVREALEVAKRELLKHAVHMEYDSPGGVPEPCGMWCDMCECHYEERGHGPICPITKIDAALASSPVQELKP